MKNTLQIEVKETINNILFSAKVLWKYVDRKRVHPSKINTFVFKRNISVWVAAWLYKTLNWWICDVSRTN